MKRKGNLSEELYKMRKLMTFNSEKFRDETTSLDRLMEEKMVEKYLLNEQTVDVDIDTVTAADSGGKGTVRGNIGGGISGGKKKKKASQEDVANLGTDVFAEDIKELAASKPPKFTLSDENAKKMSEAIITKAQVQKSTMNEIFRVGLGFDTLAIDKTKDFTRNEVSALGEKVIPKGNVVISSVVGVDENVPEIPLYNSDGEEISKFSDVQKLSDWVLNQNIESFKNNEQQYFLINFNPKGNKGQGKAGTSAGSVMAVKGDVAENAIICVGMFSEVSDPGSKTPGGEKTGKTPVDLVVDMYEDFATDSSLFADEGKARTTLLSKIKAELEKKGVKNLDVDSINIISSASNYYGKNVEATHDKSGNPIKQGINFNQKPNKTGDSAVDKNNALAWNRGMTLLNLLKNSNGSNLPDGYGKITISDTPNQSVEWRVTDTDHKVGPETGGQYAKLFIKGVAEKLTKEDVPGKITPGQVKGGVRQTKIIVTSKKTKGGINLLTWFGLMQAKYDKSGRKQRRVTNTFSGLPKWLDRIIYGK
jgi:hypothetical protein